MSIEALFFNRSKYFAIQEDKPFMIHPQKIKVKKGAELAGVTAGRWVLCNTTKEITLTCYGMFYYHNAYGDGRDVLQYVFNNPIRPSENNTGHTVGYGPAFVEASDCIPIFENGGVLRRLLTHVYQAVTAPRKVAVA